MKNNKNLKTVFTGIVVAAALTLLVLTTYWGNLSSMLNSSGIGSKNIMNLIFLWTADDETKHIVMNWKLAGIFLTLLVVAIGFAVAKMAMYTIPNKDKTSLVFDILVLFGLVLIIVGLFLPLALGEYGARDITDKQMTIMRATQVTLYAGSPIALAMSGVNGVVSLRAGK